MVWRSWMLFFFFLIMCPLVLSGDYQAVGGNSQFFLDRGYWGSSSNVGYSSYARTLHGNSTVPLVADLDGDGIQEIIVVDSSGVKLYHGKNLVLFDSWGSADPLVDPAVVLFDLDRDGLLEIILQNQLGTSGPKILGFNNSRFVVEKTVDSTRTCAYTTQCGDVALACSNSSNLSAFCVVVWVTGDGLNDASYYNSVRGQWFSYTDRWNEQLLFNPSQYGSDLCFSYLPFIDVADMDFDSEDEFIFSVSDWKNSEYRVIIFSHNLAYLGGFNVELSKSFSGFSQVSSGLKCEVYDQGRAFTSPIIYDFVNGGNLEFGFGYMHDADSFEMQIVNFAGSVVQDCPSVFYADGQIVSNLMRGKTFPDGEGKDLCLLGYDNSQGNYGFLDLACCSAITGDFPSTNEFKSWVHCEDSCNDYPSVFSTLGQAWNLTIDHGYINMLSHMAFEDSSSTSALISSYGTFWPDYSSCNYLGNCNLISWWKSPQEQLGFIQVDLYNSGHAQLIGVKPTNIWLFDDNFVNLMANLSYYYVTPCLDYIWRVNTTGEVRVRVSDPEKDLVSANVLAYYGTPFVQASGWFSWGVSSETLFVSQFKANHTITGGKIRVLVRDSGTNLSSATDFVFSVANEGVGYGQCSSEQSIMLNGSVFKPLNLNLNNNTISNMARGIGQQLGVNESLIWLFFMLCLGVAVWVTGARYQPSMTFAVFGLLEFFMLIIGVMLGFLSVALVVVVAVVSMIILGLYAKSWITGH
jgi:hypothetical protein